MSTGIEISVTTDDSGPDGPIQQEVVSEGGSDQVVKVASPPYNIAESNNNTASDSGVSNASSLASDTNALLNNGDIHGLPNPAAIESTNVDVAVTKRVEALRSMSTPVGRSGLHACRSFEAVNVDSQCSSLLEVSETEHGLSMMSLEVMTSGEQLNLMGEILGDSEGSVGTTSRSLSPEEEEEEEEEGGEGEREQEEEGASGTPPNAETGTDRSPSEGSRCSSSMGYLEPRPYDGDNEKEDPKAVQKKLLETVKTMNTTSTAESGSREEGSNSTSPNRTVTSSSSTPPPEDNSTAQQKQQQTPSDKPPSHSLSAPPSTSVSRSQSNQDLKTAAAAASGAMAAASGGSGSETSSSKGRSLGSFFRRKKMSYVGSADHTSQTLLAATSTTGLILQDRPSNLPAKSAAEERRHQKLYEQMVTAARKKELERAKQVVKKEEERRSKDKMVADSLKEWSKILPKWDSLHKTRKVRELWWYGLPPGVRGEVWKRAIGNDLNISPDLYLINLRRCRERLESLDQRERSDSTASQKSLSREQSVEVIHLDVLRTFPTLGFFQAGGPYHQTLKDVLGAYACYRPDIGYVQGMSFLAAVLLLNMEAGDAFICLANLLNRSSYLAFFRVDHTLMRPYFDSFTIFLHESMPKLSAHFEQMQFSPEYYLIEWIFTIYTRTLPLDIACRVWDMFCRDGDSFLFRTALGILRLYQSELMQFYALEDAGQFLGKLPTTISSDALFSCIDAIHLTPKRFDQVLQSTMTSPAR